MSESTHNPDDITTFWKCVPEPEQRTLIALAELAATPAGSISFTDVQAIMEMNGAVPAKERTELIFKNYKMLVVDDNSPLCNDADGCILFAGSPYLGQIWACRLTGGCEVGAPKQQPCRYSLTRPD